MGCFQRSTVHFPAEENFRFQGVIGGHASSEMLFHLLAAPAVSHGLHPFIDTKEDDFLARVAAGPSPVGEHSDSFRPSGHFHIDG